MRCVYGREVLPRSELKQRCVCSVCRFSAENGNGVGGVARAASRCYMLGASWLCRAACLGGRLCWISCLRSPPPCLAHDASVYPQRSERTGLVCDAVRPVALFVFLFVAFLCSPLSLRCYSSLPGLFLIAVSLGCLHSSLFYFSNGKRARRFSTNGLLTSSTRRFFLPPRQCRTSEWVHLRDSFSRFVLLCLLML